jgi:hypothetical protein
MGPLSLQTCQFSKWDGTEKSAEYKTSTMVLKCQYVHGENLVLYGK